MNCRNQRKIFLVDICGTLFKSNTTFDFIIQFVSDNMWCRIIKKIVSNRFILFLFNQLSNLLSIDLLRIILLRSLKGLKKSEIESRAIIFYSEYLSKLKNKYIWDLIMEKKEEGYKLVIVSATLDVIANIVANKIGADFVLSSELKYDVNMECKGKLKVDLLANKIKYLKQRNILPTYDLLVTDNDSDIDLINNTKFSYLVQYSSCKNIWKRLKLDGDYEIIEINL